MTPSPSFGADALNDSVGEVLAIASTGCGAHGTWGTIARPGLGALAGARIGYRDANVAVRQDRHLDVIRVAALRWFEGAWYLVRTKRPRGRLNRISTPRLADAGVESAI